MKKSLFVAVMLAPMFMNSSFGDGYVQLGGACMPGGAAECAPGMLCYYKISEGKGVCMSDCALARDEAQLRDSSWGMWGGLPFLWTGLSAGYLSSHCVRSSCLNADAGCALEQCYACAPGYYGNTTNGVSGCSACPTGGTALVWNVGGFNIEDCYLPAGTSAQDSTGTYTVTDDCYYSLS